MSSRYALALRIVTFVLVAAILGVAGLMVRYLVVNAGNSTPRTELERAVFAAEQAVTADPEDPTARIKLASAYLEQGAVAAAREQANIAARLAPNDPAVYYIRGLAEARDGDDEAAIKTLTKAAGMKGQLAGFYADVWAAIAAAEERTGDTKAAIAAIDEALNNGPENAVLLYERGRLYEESGRPADAYFDYVQVVNFVPDHTEANEGLTRIAKQNPEAVEQARKRFELETSTTIPAN